ncbi:MAG: AsmA-like C-terminal region-containing protein, partial [Candidatus Krumholzibacteriia bacterium]
VPPLLPTEALRAQVVRQAEAATGARVVLGEARLALLPRPALILRRGRLEGTGAGLRAAQGQDWQIESFLVDVARVEVRPDLTALLARRLEVRAVRASGPRLSVVRQGQAILTGDYRLVLGGSTLDLAAALDGGRFAGTVAVDRAWGRGGELTFSWQTQGVPAGDLLGPWLPELARRLEGRLDSSGSGSCSLGDPDETLASLNLTGIVGAGQGILHATDWLQDVAPYLGDRQDLTDIRFDRLAHVFAVGNGRYVVQELELEGPDTRWRGTGSVGLDGSLDLALQVTLPPGFTPNLGPWSLLAGTLRDQDGRVRLDLILGGRTERPSVGLDLARLKAGAADQGTEAVEKGVGRILDKWKSK